jgi:hypothetical protein
MAEHQCTARSLARARSDGGRPAEAFVRPDLSAGSRVGHILERATKTVLAAAVTPARIASEANGDHAPA